MGLTAVLIFPLLGSALSLSPLGRRFAAPITVAAAAVVFVLAVDVAINAARTGRVDALGQWLTCDGLGALVVLLVALVGATAALYSWGYIKVRAGREGARKEQRYYGLFNLFLASLLAVPVLANVALMWVAVELTTLLSAFLVGFEDTAEALEAAWKYVVLTTLGAVLALLGFLILYWGSRVAGFEPFTWEGLVGAAPHIPHSCGRRSCSYLWGSAPRLVSCRCIPGCRTRIVRPQRRSAPCCLASKRQRCSTSSCGCFR